MAARIAVILLSAALVSFLGSRECLALDSALEVNQYQHKSWTVAEGFFNGSVNAIAQTIDGYLWLGTEYGLFRFDGIRTVRWTPPQHQALPSTNIYSLLAGRDGSLWIGTVGGLARWKDGALTRYADVDGQFIFRLLEDREGTVWVATVAFTRTGKLCTIGTALRCEGGDRSLGSGPFDLFEDSRGALWLGVENGLWRWKPGPPVFYPIFNGPYGIQGIAEDEQGGLLISLRDRVARFKEGTLETAIRYPRSLKMNTDTRLLHDRDGALWVGGSDGLIHSHNGSLDAFSQSDGLSGDQVMSLFEDREGNIWVATHDGLDRFHATAITALASHQGLTIAPGSGSVVATGDGSLWVGSSEGLRRLRNGQLTIYGNATRPPSHGLDNLANPVRTISGSGLPDHEYVAVFPYDDKRILVSTARALGYFDRDHFIPIHGAPQEFVSSAVADTDGELWVASTRALIHLQGGKSQEFPWANLGHKDGARVLAVDSSRGGLWLGFFRTGIAYFRDGAVRESYGTAEGVAQGPVLDLHLDGDGTLWAATQAGLSRIKNGRKRTLTTRDGLPCNGVHWVVEDTSGSYWLSTTCGLVRIARTELQAWAAGSQRAIKPRVFDSYDGMRSRGIGTESNRATVSPDGKVWFPMMDGLGVVDPGRLSVNPLPPPVHIEEITADGKTYDTSPRLSLPPRIRDLTIAYTALSFVATGKVHFRYKLEGQDVQWREVVNDRRVQYSNLPPGHYRFRVIASNNSGVWNMQGATVDFSIAPAYWQTNWFRALCVLAVLAFLWMLYWLRMRQVAHEFDLKLEAQVEERTRIARELHDTLLQSFHGLLLRFRTVHTLLAKSPDEARQLLESAIDQTRQALTAGRNAVQGLRSAAIEAREFNEAIQALTQELASDAPHGHAAEARLKVEGTSRALQPLIRDEIYRIVAEALRNAFRHAEASHVEIQLDYDEEGFEVRVRDDGKGIDPKFLVTEDLPGHFGLRGMRERAETIGGKLTIWSAPDSGTELVVGVPASTAYASGKGARRSWLGCKVFRDT